MASAHPDTCSVENKNPLFIQGKCFNDCEVALIVGQEETQLYVCMDQLARFSQYFRVMFFGDFKEKYGREFQINDETTEDMICFFNAIDPDPIVQKINGDSIELLMRLADKYQCDLLKERLKQYIESNEPNCEIASTILNWLVWSLQYNMSKESVKVCLPGVACLPLSTLSANQDKIGLELYAKLLHAKVQVMFKMFTFHSRKLVVKKCDNCGVKDRLPYRIRCCIWCLAPSTKFMRFNCSVCMSRCEACCDDCDFYYKCRYCVSNPSAYENMEQCFCARENYKILLNQTS